MEPKSIPKRGRNLRAKKMPLGRSWGSPGRSGGHLGRVLGGLGAILERLFEQSDFGSIF